MGRFAISPGGLAASNYALGYVDGTLRIAAPVSTQTTFAGIDLKLIHSSITNFQTTFTDAITNAIGTHSSRIKVTGISDGGVDGEDLANGTDPSID